MNDYIEDKNLIKTFIEDQKEFNKAILLNQEKILIEIAIIKTKASLWGALMALIISPIVSTIIGFLMIKFLKS